MSSNTQQQPSLLRRARAKPVKTIAASRLPSHEQTQASKQNREIEQSLVGELNKYLNLIRSELDKSETLHWTQLRGVLIPRLRDSVIQTMRAHIGQSYELGAKYVTSRVGLSKAGFATHADIDNVKALSQEYTDKFFGRIELALNNTLRRSFYKNEPPDSRLNPNYIATSIAVSASSKALAEGTRFKAKSILNTNNTNNNNNPDNILSAAAAAAAATNKQANKKKKKKRDIELLPAIDPLSVEDELAAEVGLGLGLGFAGGISLATLAASQLQEQQWVWVTAENPCTEFCEPLEGEVFTMDDIDFAPVPIDDTHPHCRCRLLLL
jgi:hypothetical protein